MKNLPKLNSRAILPIVIFTVILVGFLYSIYTSSNSKVSPTDVTQIISGKFDENSLKSDAEWKKILTPKQYTVMRQAGTEIPYTGELLNEKREGTYYSYGCDKPLFRSEQKYDSNTGWPSFWDSINKDALVLRKESKPGDTRIEVLDTCGGHLGHVFDDGARAYRKTILHQLACT